QRNSIAKSSQALASRRPQAATQPISGGMAPGSAPINVHRGVFRFSGVYKNSYPNRVRSTARTREHWLQRPSKWRQKRRVRFRNIKREMARFVAIRVAGARF